MSKKAQYSLVAYDMDNTLVNGNPTYAKYIWEPTVRYFKPHLPPEEFTKVPQLFSGKTVDEANIAFIKEYALDCTVEDFSRVRQQVRQNFRFEELPLFAGIVDVLELVKLTGSLQIIITNSQKETSKHILEAKGILGYFQEVYSCADMGHPKPDPFVIEVVEREQKVVTTQIVYIGDTDIDRNFAENAHIDYFQVNHVAGGYNEMERLKKFLSIN